MQEELDRESQKSHQHARRTGQGEPEKSPACKKNWTGRAREVTSMQEELDRERDHLHRVFSNNGYPPPFTSLASKESPGGRSEEKEMEGNREN